MPDPQLAVQTEEIPVCGKARSISGKVRCELPPDHLIGRNVVPMLEDWHTGRDALGRWQSWPPTATEVRIVTCWATKCPTAAVGICCSSHRKPLCHHHYRRTHFVEVCVEGCEECAAEGLPVRLREEVASA